MSVGEYFIEPQEPPFKIVPGPLYYLRLSSSLVGHFSQHSESLCAFASKGCLMIIIIFCRHDSIFTQGWRDKEQGATDGRALLRDYPRLHMEGNGHYYTPENWSSNFAIH